MSGSQVIGCPPGGVKGLREWELDLLVVSRLSHLAVRSRLRALQRLVDRDFAGQSRAHLLSDRNADGLKLRDGSKLNTDVRRFRQRAVIRIRSIDRLLLGVGKLGRLQKFRCRVGALARARRDAATPLPCRRA